MPQAAPGPVCEFAAEPPPLAATHPTETLPGNPLSLGKGAAPQSASPVCWLEALPVPLAAMHPTPTEMWLPAPHVLGPLWVFAASPLPLRATQPIATPPVASPQSDAWFVAVPVPLTAIQLTGPVQSGL